MGLAMGVPGATVGELTATHAAKGEISGSIRLNSAEITALTERGALYPARQRQREGRQLLGLAGKRRKAESMTPMRLFAASAAALLLVLMLGRAQGQQQTSGVFAPDQIRVGQAEYLENCAGCHGNTLAGANDFPALAGAGFMQNWGNRSTKALYQFISTSMPAGNEGSLSADAYADITAFLLSANGATPGSQVLTGNTDVRIASVANGQVPADVQKGLAAAPARTARRPAPGPAMA